MNRVPPWRLRSRKPGISIATLGTCLLGAGCANTAGIPCGEWSGWGTFVYQAWDSDDSTSLDSDGKSVHRRYKTTLSVHPGTLDGREVVELEIFSYRGDLPGLHAGDKTHLKIALLEAERLSETTVLYRLAGSLFNPGPDETLKIDDDAKPVAASCTTMNGVVVLQIQYGEDFVDTFRFAGRHVEKNGAWFDPGGGLIHWSERLAPRY